MIFPSRAKAGSPDFASKVRYVELFSFGLLLFWGKADSLFPRRILGEELADDLTFVVRLNTSEELFS